MASQTYLITGANRGIGLGLLTALIQRPSTTIVAAVRDVASASKIFSSLPVGSGSKIVTVKIDSTVDSDPAAAVEELKTKHGIEHIDTLVSNAGLLDIIAPVLETPADQVRKHFEVNTIGPLVLFQAFHPLLVKSKAPKFLVITSTIGSIGKMQDIPVPFFAYGISKSAANYLVRKISFESPEIVSIAYNPGWVQTDMGSGAAKGVGMADAPMSKEDSIKNVIARFDEADLSKTGSFIENDGTIVPW